MVCNSRCTWRELRSAKPDSHCFRQRALSSPSQEAEACEEESQAPELPIPRQSFQPFIWTRNLPWPPLRDLVWIQHLRTHSNSSSIEPPTTALKLLCGTLLRAAILRGLRRLQAIQQIQRLLKPFWINVNNLTQYPQGWCSRCSLKLWRSVSGFYFQCDWYEDKICPKCLKSIFTPDAEEYLILSILRLFWSGTELIELGRMWSRLSVVSCNTAILQIVMLSRINTWYLEIQNLCSLFLHK